MIAVLIADDQPLIREALRSVFAHETGIEIVGEASDGHEAVEVVTRLRPDVVIMDIRMPGMNGLDALHEIRADPSLRETKVLMLTTFEDDENVLAAIRAGAAGFIGKDSDLDSLVDGVKRVHSGEAMLSPRAARALIDRFVTPETASEDHPALAGITARETEILHLVARGLSNVQIASTLSISVATAKTHVNRMMAKLKVHDRAQLVIIAYESGVLTRRGGSTLSA